ncbi:hypothetical protein ACFLVU_02720 [Chloroflexota bacterium]
MFSKGVLRDIVLFIAIVFLLLWVIPAISSLLKQLLILQVVIAIVGALVLRYLVQKIRRRIK